jgi:hypothetical protein
MGFEYLNKRNWLEITREERLFCAHLYWKIKGNEQDFINWLNETSKTNYKSEYWEVGYEVCFYRDLIKAFDKKSSIKIDGEYSTKRTFDLCLFGDNDILIFEAKAFQGFDTKQFDSFLEDKKKIPDLMKKFHIPASPNIYIFLIISSKYKIENSPLYKRIEEEKMKKIKWLDIYSKYNDKAFIQADNCFNFEQGFLGE